LAGGELNSPRMADRKPAPLDSLTKEELVSRCKSLLQIAQKAKSSKDEAQMKLEVLEASKSEEMTTAASKLEELRAVVESKDDIIESKDRRLKKLADDNDSILEEMNTYHNQLKLMTSENSGLKENLLQLKKDLEKKQNLAAKMMEHEANLICLKENEKQLCTKIHELEGKCQAHIQREEDLNNQLLTMNLKLAAAETSVKQSEELLKTSNHSSKSDLDKLVKEKQKVEIDLLQSIKESEEKEKALEALKDELSNAAHNFSEELQSKSSEKDDLINNLKEEVSSLQNNIALNETNNETSQAETSDRIRTLQTEIEEHQSKNQGLIEELNHLNLEVKKRGERIERLDKANSEQGFKLREAEKDLKQNREQLHCLLLEKTTDTLKRTEEEYQDLITKKSEIEIENRVLTQQLNGMNDELKGAVEMRERLKTMEIELKMTKKNKLDIQENLEQSQLKIESLEKEILENKNFTSCQKSISAETETKLADLRKEMDECRAELGEKEKECLNFHQEQTLLKSKVIELKEELASVHMNNSVSSVAEHDDSRSEVMSTSTVSRVDQENRMRDVEDHFEDRYTKLKLIAIKLKKKCGDHEKTIKELEVQISLKAEVDPSLKDRVEKVTKNFNNLQSQYDDAMDKLETSEAEVKTMKKDLEGSLAECIASKQKCEEALQQSLASKTELTRKENDYREIEVKFSALEVTLQEERKERKQLEENCKINSSLSLKLSEKTSENLIIEETLNSLKLQVAQYEESLVQEKERADSAHSSLQTTRLQLAQLEADLSRQRIEADELALKHENSIQSNEALQEQAAVLARRSEQTQAEEKNTISHLERQIATLETNLNTTAQKLDDKEQEIVKISSEFDKYKTRAQSVLKQSKDKTNPEEEMRKKREDIFSLEKMNDLLNEKLKSVGLEIRTVTLERNSLQEEHDRLMGRHSLLLQELATKEKSWREKIEQKELKIKQVDEEKEGNIARIQNTIENLKQIHQQEIEILKNANENEISKLKTVKDSTENELIRLEIVLQKEQEARRRAEEAVGKTDGMVVSRFDNRIDISEMEREACEGQEVETEASAGSLTSPVPLDQLLAQADTAGSPGEEVRGGAGSRVGGADRQISHLAALLAEAEAQNTRLEKLTEVLKEEIRTYQRSEERHKHIENLEYVKNVILKFLTLTGHQEKIRLVPVLQTILKLSKEEVGKIEEFIKAEGDGGGGQGEGWGSYLQLWSTSSP